MGFFSGWGMGRNEGVIEGNYRRAARILEECEKHGDKFPVDDIRERVKKMALLTLRSRSYEAVLHLEGIPLEKCEAEALLRNRQKSDSFLREIKGLAGFWF